MFLTSRDVKDYRDSGSLTEGILNCEIVMSLRGETVIFYIILVFIVSKRISSINSK